jgi:hypothetical protein
LSDRICDVAASVALISRSMQNTGMPAALAVRTLAIEPSASVGLNRTAA